MSEIMNLLRGPAMGVVVMIILMSGVIIVTAFAALFAQVGLLLRLKSRENAGQSPVNRNSYTKEDHQSSPDRSRSPQVVVSEPDMSEVIDGVWWQVR